MAECLDNVNYLTMAMQTYEVGSTFYARPTHLPDPRNFYVLPLVHQNVVYEIQRPGGMYEQDDLHVNNIVIYYSQAVNGYVRGNIHNITEESKCHMYALDNGFMEKNVGVERIFHPVHDAALHTPGLVRLCELEMCTPIDDRFVRDTLEAFRHFIGNERLYVEVRAVNGEKLRVKLFNSYPEDIGTLLSMNQFAAASNYRPPAPRQITFDWKYPKLEVGQTLHVRVQYGFSINGFFACTQGDYTDYLKNRMEFSFYCQAQPQIPYSEFVPGKSIGVMENVGEPFERAIIIDVIDVGYRAKVKLIDWGKEFITEINKVKLIRSEIFFAKPARAIYCSAPNSKTWNNGLPSFLYKGFALAITIERVGKELEVPYIVSLSPAPQN